MSKKLIVVATLAALALPIVAIAHHQHHATVQCCDEGIRNMPAKSRPIEADSAMRAAHDFRTALSDGDTHG